MLWREIYDKIPNLLVSCRLAERQEAVGVLVDVLEKESFAVDVFDWGSISLPLDLATEFREQVGK